MRIEATLVDDQHVLLALSARPALAFFGAIIGLHDLAAGISVTDKTVYVTGDLARLDARALAGAARVFVVDELAEGAARLPRVGLGRLPLRVGDAGVYYPRFFEDDLFQRICAEHAFQALTESAKPSKAHRTGIYLTPVTQHGDALHFHLLRCSTNLAGPTENFCATDEAIVDALNREAASIFRDHAPLNHVLAQVYKNTRAGEGQRETKAKISAHADKTKDMPANGIMAFCTFYDGLDRLGPIAADRFDRGHREKTGLTKLQFRPKEGVTARPFTLTLYPGSVFFMPLSTNRLYTHEIQSSILNADMLPTRLGYVVRCSKTAAVHAHGTTFLQQGDALVPLEPATAEGTQALRALYAAENRTDAVIDYGNRFRFSMNEGDYRAPDLKRG